MVSVKPCNSNETIPVQSVQYEIQRCVHFGKCDAPRINEISMHNRLNWCSLHIPLGFDRSKSLCYAPCHLFNYTSSYVRFT